jgi:translation initiation factor 4B
LFWGCDVKTVRLVRDKLNDRPKGFGYVEFNTKEGLIAATELNGVNVCGRNIRVSIARPRKKIAP